ncbi:MAG: GNAT family N-acetyltransferase [Lentilitoribacter sp.]
MNVVNQPVDFQIVPTETNAAKSSQTLGRIGSLEVRLTTNEKDIRAAQALRYKIFVEEMGAILSPSAMALELDFDTYDKYCEHFILLDTSILGGTNEQIIGTYRILRQQVADQHDGFYSQNEFDINALTKRHSDKRFVELGRSCVLKEYRTRRSVELLWQGIWAYAGQHEIDVMFGCASFFGGVPAAHAHALSFLYHYAKTSDEWSVAANPAIAHEIDLMPKEAIVTKQVFAALPPLIKGYLRLGASFAPQAVIDKDFNTTDVLVMLPVSQISERYIKHYRPNADRFN